MQNKDGVPLQNNDEQNEIFIEFKLVCEKVHVAMGHQKAFIQRLPLSEYNCRYWLIELPISVSHFGYQEIFMIS